jgi:hypothetical protein
MAVRSDSRAGRPLPPGRFLVLFSIRGVDPRAIVWLEGLGQLKNPMTSSGIEPATFRLVAYSASTNYATAYYFKVKSKSPSQYLEKLIFGSQEYVTNEL